MGSISHQIMPLVITSLGSRHTSTICYFAQEENGWCEDETYDKLRALANRFLIARVKELTQTHTHTHIHTHFADKINF